MKWSKATWIPTCNRLSALIGYTDASFYSASDSPLRSFGDTEKLLAWARNYRILKCWQQFLISTVTKRWCWSKGSPQSNGLSPSSCSGAPGRNELQNNGPRQPRENTKAAYNKTPVNLLGTQMCVEFSENPMSYSTRPYPTVTVIPDRACATCSHTWGWDKAEQDAEAPQPGPGGCRSRTLCPSTGSPLTVLPIAVGFPIWTATLPTRASKFKHKLWSFRTGTHVRPPAFRPQQKETNQISTAPKIHPLLVQGYPRLTSPNLTSILLFALLSRAANITPTRFPKQDVCFALGEQPHHPTSKAQTSFHYQFIKLSVYTDLSRSSTGNTNSLLSNDSSLFSTPKTPRTKVSVLSQIPLLDSTFYFWNDNSLEQLH